MKEKNMRKIAEKMKAIGKVKVEKDGKGNEYIVFDSDLLQCTQEVHAETLERDLLYIRDLMLMEAEEEENTFADDLRLRNAWLYANERIAWLQAKWEKIIPDIHVTVILREGGSGDMYAVRLRTAGYDEEEFRQIWHDSGMCVSVFLDRLKDLGCEPDAEKVKWNFSD